MKSTASAIIANRLNKTFTTHRFPCDIVTNNAPNLTSVQVTDYCKQHGINHHKTTPYQLKGNSEIECFYRKLGKQVRCIKIEGKHLEKRVLLFHISI